MTPNNNKGFSLPRFSIENPHLTIVVSILMIALGIYAYLSIAQRMVPRIPTPNLGIVTKFPGMSAEDMERYITRPLEKRIQIVGGVAYTLGVSQPGYSKIVTYFDYDVDLVDKRLEMQSLLNTLSNELPKAGPNTTVPRLIHVDRQNVPLLQFAVKRAGINKTNLKSLIENELKTEFQKGDGVLAVTTFGGQDRQIIIEIDKNKLSAFGVSITQVRKSIDAANFNRGGGALSTTEDRIEVLINNEYEEQELLVRLPKLPIATVNNKVIYLEDVATVKDTYAQLYGDFFYNGEPAIWLGVQAEPSKDYITVAEQAKSLAKLMESEYPGLSFDVIFDKTFYMELNDSNALHEFILALSIASFVMLLFLGELAGTFIAAAILPSAIAFGFFIIHILGFQRDFGIMMGLVFVVGKLVDDSVVVVEAIRRYIERGVHPRLAAIKGTEEVLSAITGATLVFAVMLVPMTLMTGDMGSGFRSMTLPMITSVITSLFLALTLTPLMASYLFKPTPNAIKTEEALQKLNVSESMEPEYNAPPGMIGKVIYHLFLRHYFAFERVFAKFIERAIHYRWIVVALTVSAIWISFTLYDSLEQEQMPLTDTSLMLGYVRATPGTSAERMREIVPKIQKIALAEENVKDASALVGQSPVWGQYFTGYGVNRVNEARMIINLTIARQEREESLWDIQERIVTKAKANIPELDVLFFQPITPTPVAAARAPVEVIVKGPELEQVHEYGEQIFGMAINESRGLHDPYLDMVKGVPQIMVEIDEPRAISMNLKVNDIVGQIYHAINGGKTVNFFNPEPMRYHNRFLIRYKEDQRTSIEDLEQLMLATPDGSRVPVSSVARFRKSNGVDRIHTYDTLYAASVLGYYKELGLKETTMSLMLPAKMQITPPKGYSVGPAGLMGTMLKAFNELQSGLKVALIAVFLMLVVQFRSFPVAMILMLAIPLQGIGALGALWLRDMAWSPPVLWGMVILAGIVLSNSILIIDRILELRQLGLAREHAVKLASQLRLRPVLMTALTTASAVVPVAIYPPPATEQFRNIATAMAGGLLTSTVMTLVAIPVAYMLMDEFICWIKRFYSQESLGDKVFESTQTVDKTLK